MSQGILTITDENFEKEVLQSSNPFLLDFWAPWCGPCKALGPVFEDVAQEMGSSVRFGKMNIDDNKETPVRYQIMSIPTLVLFKDGKHVDTKTGLLSQETLKEWLEDAAQ